MTKAAAGRVLGLDLGQARIGVAISDPDRRLALPLGTVRTGAPADLKAIAALAHEHDVELIVVGLPLRLTGEHGPEAEQAATFADTVRDALGLPVELQDERFSTVEAERHLRDAGLRGQDRRAVVDPSAAAVLLQAWLDRHR